MSKKLNDFFTFSNELIYGWKCFRKSILDFFPAYVFIMQKTGINFYQKMAILTQNCAF
jgi:hypothetical protein